MIVNKIGIKSAYSKGGHMAKQKISSQSINKYKKELESIFDGVTGKQKKILDIQIERVAFMMAQCDNLEEIIKVEGSIELFKNGAQEMLREHPAMKIYNIMIKNYISIIKQLIDMTPETKQEKDELLKFLESDTK